VNTQFSSDHEMRKSLGSTEEQNFKILSQIQSYVKHDALTWNTIFSSYCHVRCIRTKQGSKCIKRVIWRHFSI